MAIQLFLELSATRSKPERLLLTYTSLIAYASSAVLIIVDDGVTGLYNPRVARELRCGHWGCFAYYECVNIGSEEGVAGLLLAIWLNRNSRGERIGARVIAHQIRLPLALMTVVEEDRLGGHEFLALLHRSGTATSLAHLPRAEKAFA